MSSSDEEAASGDEAEGLSAYEQKRLETSAARPSNLPA
jgi:hypothetical protein